MQLSKHFTLKELTASNTARQLNIYNFPSSEVQGKLQRLCVEILEPLREAFGEPIVVTSGYRCKALNNVVSPKSPNSDHCHGCAADIRSLSDSWRDNRRLFDTAQKLINEGKIVVKQLIDEYGYDWIHISLQDGRTDKRNQILHLG